MPTKRKPRKTTDPLRRYRRLSVSRLVELLTAELNTPVTVEMIRSDIAAGAPTNSDGTIDLVRYAAWLTKHRAKTP